MKIRLTQAQQEFGFYFSLVNFCVHIDWDFPAKEIHRIILSWLDVVLSYPLSLCLKAKVTCCISHLDSIPDLAHRIPDPLLVIRLHWDVMPSPSKAGLSC